MSKTPTFDWLLSLRQEYPIDPKNLRFHSIKKWDQEQPGSHHCGLGCCSQRISSYTIVAGKPARIVKQRF